MAYAYPTIDDFKGQFFRDFPYAVPAYGATAVAVVVAGVVTALTPIGQGFNYNAVPTVAIASPPAGGTQAMATATLLTGGSGQVSAYTITAGGSGYGVVPPLVTVTPAPTDGDNTDLKLVTDRDIASAQVMAKQQVAQALFGVQGDFTYAANLLAAHYLCTNIFASSQGLGGAAEWLTASKTVGDVAQTFNIPDRITKSPYFSLLSKTTYGAQYLSLVAIQSVANVRVVAGGGWSYGWGYLGGGIC